MLLWSLFAVVIMAVDQLTKFFVVKYISASDIITVIPGLFEFVYVKNKGAAFNILSGRLGFLSLISLLFAAGVIWYMIVKKPQNKMCRVSLMLLFAGALGNAIDRVFRGFVVDFIKTSFINFPVFNVADIAITIGAALFIIYLMFFDNKKE